MTGVGQRLQDRWTADTLALPASEGDRSRIFRDLVASYSEVHRHYHTLAHIAAVFECLEEFRSTISNWTVVAFAVWYHDIIYDTKRSDNEALSSVRAKQELATLGMRNDDIAKVESLILATADHLGSVVEPDGDYFLDADFSILAAPAERYRAYSSEVRAEYGWVPESAWKAGRSQFLQKAAASPRIFRTEIFEIRFSEQARANLAWELRELSRG